MYTQICSAVQAEVLRFFAKFGLVMDSPLKKSLFDMAFSAVMNDHRVKGFITRALSHPPESIDAATEAVQEEFMEQTTALSDKLKRKMDEKMAAKLPKKKEKDPDDE